MSKTKKVTTSTASVAVAKQRATSGTSERFFLIFCATCVLTLVTGGTQVSLAYAWLEPSPLQISIIESLGSAWKTGVGAIFALMAVR
jgi:hypothetical protein